MLWPCYDGVMNYWLGNFTPPSILFVLGPLQIHYYGLIMVLAISASVYLAMKLTRIFRIESVTILDLSFWLIVNGLLGARLYHVGLELPYYLSHPQELIMIWHGGLAIHGAVLAGALTIWYYARTKRISFWLLTACVAPALLLGQTIGRWGNYFNQELFGLPTNLPWGIFIEARYRPEAYLAYSHFHPTFLYESLTAMTGLVIIMLGLKYWRSKPISLIQLGQGTTAWYLIIFGLYRFLVEFIKVDITPSLGIFRWPQVISLVSLALGLVILVRAGRKDYKNNSDQKA